jgi:hypothetical protein
MAKYKTWKELDQALIDNGGVLSVSGHTLKTIQGVQRIGTHVRRDIKKALDARDIAIDHPDEFYGESLVRLYKRDTPAAEIIEAVNNMGREHDDTIRHYVNADGGKLVAIRQILNGG